LNGSEGYEVEMGIVLVNVQELRELLSFLSGAAFHEWKTMEVDEG
jgi:hypothetical protein